MQSSLFALRKAELGPGSTQGRVAWGYRSIKPVSAAAIASVVAVLGMAPQGLSQVYDTVPPLPAGAMPVPGATLPPVPASGQQYLIYVNDTSDATLNQVRLVEPTAFRTTFQGRSVIQAGRFNMTGNAQQRVTDLAALGITAEMAQVSAAIPSYAQGPALPANVYASNGDLPPLPDTAFPAVSGTPGVPVPALPPGAAQVPPVPGNVAQVPPAPGNVAQIPPAPGNVEFGQELNYGIPPAPSNGVSIPPPAVTPPTAQAVNAPYYVVIPTSASNLMNLSNQVIQLGTPAGQVQQRTQPLGPHVAVGPFTDQGLANRWNNFFRESGIPNSRVYFQR